jgi:protoporphyrinogen oxidase
MALITKRPLTPFYVLNIADDRIPFTGVIGMSSVVETEDTNGLYLTYLPKYILSTDEELRRPEDELRSEFLQALRLIFPDLPDDQIVGSRIHRAFKVQPLQVLEYSKLIPRQETRHPDFFVLNTAQFVHNTLNNNEVVRAVDEFVEAYGDRLSAPPLVSGESARDNI